MMEMDLRLSQLKRLKFHVNQIGMLELQVSVQLEISILP